MNYIKKTIFIFCLNITNILIGWSGHAIPMTFDKSSNQWLVLLMHNPITGLWQDFWYNPKPEEDRAHQTAARALRELTSGVYNVNLKGSTWFNDNNKILHFVTVDYIPANTLRENGCNANADNFFWLPLSTLTQAATIEHNGKHAAVSVHTKHAIKMFAPKFLHSLNAHTEIASHANSIPSTMHQFEITSDLMSVIKK